MRFWFALLSALVLAFAVWGGAAANAAAAHSRQAPEAIECVEVGSQEESGCLLTGSHHHHASCSGHYAAIPPAEVAAAALIGEGQPRNMSWQLSLTGRSPPSELRPPIA